MIQRLNVVLSAFLCFIFLQCNPTEDRTRAEIKEVMDSMEAYWNSGDLDRYMSYYAQRDSITFQSGAVRYHGWETVKGLFVPMFQNEEIRGRLHFSGVEMIILSDAYVFAIGKFNLLYPDSRTREGYFTVLYKKFRDGWKIVHDHS